MLLLPRSRRGTWLLAGAVWAAASAGLWWALPVAPRVEIPYHFGECGFTDDGKKWFTQHIPSTPFHFWDIQSGSQLPAWSPAGKVHLLSPKHELAITSSNDPTPRVYLHDLASGQSEAITWWIAESKQEIYRTADGRYLAIALYYDNKVKTVWWDRQSGKTVAELVGKTPLAVARDGRWVTIGETPTDLVVRAPASSRELLRIHRDSKWSGVLFLGDGSYVAIQEQLYQRIVDSLNGNTCARIPVSDYLAYVSDTHEVIAIDRENLAFSRWDLRTGHSVGQGQISIPPTAKFDFDLRCSPESAMLGLQYSALEPMPVFRQWVNRYLLSIESDGSDTFTVFDLRSGKELMRFQPRGYPSFGFIPGGQTLVTIPLRGDNIQFWDIPPRNPLTWFAAGASLLAVPIFWIARRRVRKLRGGAA